MSASVSLPPSGRDFLVYHRVVVDAVSTRAVAAEIVEDLKAALEQFAEIQADLSKS